MHGPPARVRSTHLTGAGNPVLSDFQRDVQMLDRRVGGRQCLRWDAGHLASNRLELGDSLPQLGVGNTLRFYDVNGFDGGRVVFVMGRVQRVDGQVDVMDGFGAMAFVIVVGLVQKLGGRAQVDYVAGIGAGNIGPAATVRKPGRARHWS